MFTAPATTATELVVNLVITHHTGDDSNAELDLYMKTDVSYHSNNTILIFFSRIWPTLLVTNIPALLPDLPTLTAQLYSILAFSLQEPGPSQFPGWEMTPPVKPTTPSQSLPVT
jgi:hypothetical protein